MSHAAHSTHTFSNYKKVISLADHDWETAESGRVSGLNVEVKSANHLLDQFGRTLHHFCTTSYLGLDYHPEILKGAIDALKEAGTLRIANSKNCCKLAAIRITLRADMPPNLIKTFCELITGLLCDHGKDIRY